MMNDLKVKQYGSESEIHKLIKIKVGEALESFGYDVTLEKITDDGRIDVFGSKGSNEIKVEIIKSHIPEWLLLKVHGDLNLPKPITKTTKKKLIFDCSEELWDEVLKYKIDHNFRTANEAVIDLVKKGLKA